MKLSLDKVAVAERQLVQAVRMYFREDDIVAIHTICAAAYQILSDICKEKKIYRQLEDNEIFKKLGLQKKVVQSYRKPQNFFKHADKDSNQKIDFNSQMTEVIIALAIDLFRKLTDKTTSEFKVYTGWFTLKYPETQNDSLKTAFQKLSPLPDYRDLSFFRNAIENKAPK